MFIRTFVLVIGFCGALGAAQFPAFSQQYMQRLGGAVDALAVVIANFDASAQAAGLSRDEALGQMTGTVFLERRGADMSASIARYERLKSDLAVLTGQGPFTRAYHAARFTDPQIARGAMAAFRPSLPLSFASAVFAAFGFVTAALSALLALRLVAPRRRQVPLLA